MSSHNLLPHWNHAAELVMVFLHIRILIVLCCRFGFCDVPGSQAVCPPGMNKNDPCLEDGGCYQCPAHRDCYLSCSEAQWGSWFSVPGSAYNDKAFCERFPRGSAETVDTQWEFLAQTGKSNVVRHNFDTVYSSIVTIFQILTGVRLQPQLSDVMIASCWSTCVLKATSAILQHDSVLFWNPPIRERRALEFVEITGCWREHAYVTTVSHLQVQENLCDRCILSGCGVPPSLWLVNPDPRKDCTYSPGPIGLFMGIKVVHSCLAHWVAEHCTCAGENWNAVMYDGMRATNASAALYFLFIVIIGNYVVLNLFLAILLEQFSNGDKDEAPSKLPETACVTTCVADNEQSMAGCETELADVLEAKAADSSNRKFRPLHEPIRMESGSRAGNMVVPSRMSRTVSRIFLQDDMEQSYVSNMLEGHSLFIFGPHNPVRVFLARIVWHQRFEQLIITLIVLSSIVLAIDAPSLDPNGDLKATLVRSSQLLVAS